MSRMQFSSGGMLGLGWSRVGILLGVCAAIIAFYAQAMPATSRYLWGPPTDEYYNRLVAGFRAGQLNLAMEVEPGFAALPDPYDPAANASFRALHKGGPRVHDLSYYRGRFYLYFGITPTLILFWPVTALSGHLVSHATAVLVFVSIGFLAYTAFLVACWRRYFSDVPFVVSLLGVTALGLLSTVPFLLQRPAIWEVPVSCAFAMSGVTLLLLWRALHNESHAAGWTALASLAYGLAIGARPSLVFGAIVLLAPALSTWATRAPGDARRRYVACLKLAVAAILPVGLVGAGLLWYNYARFGNALEFGQTYQLAGDRQDTVQHFGFGYFWFNFRMYFLQPAGWKTIFPFVQQAQLPPLPPGHGAVEPPWGVLTNMPFLLLAFASPLAWKGRTGSARALLPWVAAVPLTWFVFSTGLMCLFYGMALRYQMEFVPSLALLASIGLFGLERATKDAAWRRHVFRCGWILLWVVSIAFSVFATIMVHALMLFSVGEDLRANDSPTIAIPLLESALRLKPDLIDARNSLISAYGATRDFKAARTHFEQLLRDDPAEGPRYADWFTDQLIADGRTEEALLALESGVRLLPNSALLHNKLGLLLHGMARSTEAIPHFERAVQLDPRMPQAASNLGAALAQIGKLEDAAHWLEQAIKLDPRDARAHLFLGQVCVQRGQLDAAESHYEQALQIDPGLEIARDNLLVLRTERQRLRR